MAAAAVFVRRGERTRRVSGCQKDTTKIQPAKVATILDEKHKRITNLINKGCLLFYIICPPLINLGDRFGLCAPWETLPPELCRPLHEVVVPNRKRDSPLRRLTLHSSFNLLVWLRLLVACFPVIFALLTLAPLFLMYWLMAFCPSETTTRFCAEFSFFALQLFC